MNATNFNIIRLFFTGRSLFWFALVLLNVFIMTMVARQAMADYFFSKVVHKRATWSH